MKLVTLCDDDETFRFLLEAILAGDDIDLRAYEGPDYIPDEELLDADLLLTDWMMPGIGGAGLIERARKLRPDLPIMVYSALVRPPDDFPSGVIWYGKGNGTIHDLRSAILGAIA